jgi:hypothetical protein
LSAPPNPNQSTLRNSLGGQQTASTSGNILFTLSPLNEFDEEYDNPLNKAMILETTSSVGGGNHLLWSSKQKEDQNEEMLSPQTSPN